MRLPTAAPGGARPDLRAWPPLAAARPDPWALPPPTPAAALPHTGGGDVPQSASRSRRRATASPALDPCMAVAAVVDSLGEATFLVSSPACMDGRRRGKRLGHGGPSRLPPNGGGAWLPSRRRRPTPSPMAVPLHHHATAARAWISAMGIRPSGYGSVQVSGQRARRLCQRAAGPAATSIGSSRVEGSPRR